MKKSPPPPLRKGETLISPFSKEEYLEVTLFQRGIEGDFGDKGIII